jgi:hypothetical protein
MKTILKYPLMAALAACTWTSCTTVQEEDNKTEAVLEEDKPNTADSLQLAFAQTLNEIDQNLDLIREKEGALVLGPESNAEHGITKSEHIKRNISIINSLMEQNREKIEKLTAQLKKSKKSNALLTKLTEGTKEKMQQQEDEIAQLKTQLADKSFELAALSITLSDLQLAHALLQEKADKLDKDAGTAYYAVGSYKELKKENVVAGSMFGKKTLKDDFKKEYFTQIDTRQTDSIPLFAKRAKLVTAHPKNSFALEKDKNKVTYLKIKDPDAFWRMSKYLVVEVQI